MRCVVPGAYCVNSLEVTSAQKICEMGYKKSVEYKESCLKFMHHATRTMHPL